MGASLEYQRGQVTVDAHFARFGSKSYAIDKINSVDVRVEKRAGCLWISVAAIAAILGLAAIGNSVSATANGSGQGWGLFVVAAAFAFILYRARPKPLYHLMLATSSGEVQATKSTDKEAIGELREAIEAAMAGRA